LKYPNTPIQKIKEKNKQDPVFHQPFQGRIFKSCFPVYYHARKWKRKKQKSPPGMCGNIKTIRRPGRETKDCGQTVHARSFGQGSSVVQGKKKRSKEICPKGKESWWPSPVDHDQRDQLFCLFGRSMAEVREMSVKGT